MWTIEEATLAISSPGPGNSIENFVTLPLFVEAAIIGLGVDGLGQAVLVLPGSQEVPEFQTKALKFDPWCKTTVVESGKLVERTAVLRCRFDRSDQSVVRLVANLMTSLIDLQVSFGDANKAILALRNLFANGFNVNPDRFKIIGLVGELLLIQAAMSPSRAISAWHVDIDDRYDFSVGSRRVEVKTTTSSVRQHRFSSRQLPPGEGIQVQVASVQLPEVAVGQSLADLYGTVIEDLDSDSAQLLVSQIVATLGLPPRAVRQPLFDLDSARASIRFFSSSKVPTPASVPGVTEVNWSALLNEGDAQSGSLDDLFPPTNN